MAFEVGLGFEIDAEFVTEIVEIRVAGIVRRAHVVDVRPFHHHHLFKHLLSRNGVASFGIRLVAVHTLEFHGFSIDVEIASSQSELVVFSFRVTNFHRSEADLRRNGLCGATFVVFQLGHEHVEIRLFGAPRLDGRRTQVDARRRRDDLTIFVGIKVVFVEAIDDFVVLRELVVILHQRIDNQPRPTTGPVGPDAQVLEANFRRGIDADAAENARQAEHILRFEERAVGVAIDLDRNRVFAHFRIIRDVETGGVARIFRETNVFSVHPKVEKRIDTVELDENLLFFPLFRHGERAAIRTHFVAIFVSRPVRRRRAHHTLAPVIDLALVIENHGLVHIDGNAVFAFPTAFLLVPRTFLQPHDVPVRRHGNVVPRRAVEVLFVEIERSLVGRLGEMELPRSVEADAPRTVLGQHFPRLIRRGKRHKPRPRLHFVVAQSFGRLPFRAVGGLGAAVFKAVEPRLDGHQRRRFPVGRRVGEGWELEEPAEGQNHQCGGKKDSFLHILELVF